jgi:hypothetical protein
MRHYSLSQPKLQQLPTPWDRLLNGKSITVARARSGRGSPGNLQLMAQSEIFEDQRGVGSTEERTRLKTNLKSSIIAEGPDVRSSYALPSPTTAPEAVIGGRTLTGETGRGLAGPSLKILSSKERRFR